MMKRRHGPKEGMSRREQLPARAQDKFNKLNQNKIQIHNKKKSSAKSLANTLSTETAAQPFNFKRRNIPLEMLPHSVVFGDKGLRLPIFRCNQERNIKFMITKLSSVFSF
jgi:hypothetical protein